ncbi:hypothetical protein M3Y96_00542900 [Aphelenchoides besseyi]|nr:hypothetical protein M3Y96_00542900 [Aphelenchoides besseyi]
MSDLYVDDPHGIYIENVCKKDRLKSENTKTTTPKIDVTTTTTVLTSTSNSTQKTAVTQQSTISSTASSLPTTPMAIPAHVIDNYGMPDPTKSSRELHFQFQDQVIESNKKDCFREFYPPNIKTNRVVRSNSIHDCVRTCRECEFCLSQKSKCTLIGFSVEQGLCALANQLNSSNRNLQQLKRSESMGSFVFMERFQC